MKLSMLPAVAAFLVTAAFCMTAPPNAAAATGPVAATPAATPFKIGELQAFALLDAGFAAANDGKIFGTDASRDEVAKVLAAAGAPTDSIALSVSALLVRDGRRLILIDTGLGPTAHGILLESLARAGFSANDVTDVLITHSHGDHVGGLATADGQPAFPKATVRMSSAEWAYMKSRTETAPLVKAVAAQVKTFEPGAVLAPGITAVAIKGHTPGHVGYEITSGHDRLLDIGDTAHSSIVSLAKPEWAMGFDADKAAAKASREALLRDASQSHETIFSPHFPYPGVGKIQADGGHFTWQPTLTAAS